MKDDPVATNDRTSSAEAEAEARTSAKDGAKETSRPRRPGDLEGKDHAIGLGIAAVYVGWLLATARTLGFCRDEGFYFNASSRYAQWFRVLFERPQKRRDRTCVGWPKRKSVRRELRRDRLHVGGKP